MNTKKRVTIISIVSLVLFSLLLFFTPGLSTSLLGYNLANTNSEDIYVHSTCREVTNNLGKNLFIPTKTATEWNDFLTFAASEDDVSTAYDDEASYGCYKDDVYYYDNCNVLQGRKIDCAAPNTYFCTGSGSNDRWKNTGCSSGSCSSEYVQTCADGTVYCPTEGGSDLRQYTGCSDGSCTSTSIGTCTTSGSYCDGSTNYVVSYIGCRGSACATSRSATACPTTDTCSNNYVVTRSGCSDGECQSSRADNPCPTTNTCSNDYVVTRSGCSGGECQSSTADDPCPTTNTCSNGYVVTRSGCSGGTCQSSTATTPCPTTGTYCSGDYVVSNIGCSGGECQTSTATTPCQYGCNSATGACNSCTVSTWSPNVNTVCSGTSFTQTSNCDTTRTATGTKTDGACAPSCPNGQEFCKDKCYDTSCPGLQYWDAGICACTDLIDH